MKKIFLSVLLVLALLPFNSWTTQDELIAGTAASTEITELFFAHFHNNFACAEYDFKVMTTPIRHKRGGLTTNRFIFSRTGNSLDRKERQMGKEEILLGNIKLMALVGWKQVPIRLSWSSGNRS
ncbi:hypothetical protein [Malonomonas rubra]|uniref:hypothetical protein n=1 Tax=Malonomonas rubra TaxID=57040 RepID=UPI0026F318ED|nr:hypothetical protein [Malonomonas rubra]